MSPPHIEKAPNFEKVPPHDHVEVTTSHLKDTSHVIKSPPQIEKTLHFKKAPPHVKVTT